MNERTKWAGALLLALATNALLLLVILLQISGLLVIYGVNESAHKNFEASKYLVETESSPLPSHAQTLDLPTRDGNGGNEESVENSKDVTKQNSNLGQLSLTSKSERLELIEKEILNIFSEDLFLDKVVDSLIKKQNSDWDLWLSSQIPSKVPRHFKNLFQKSTTSVKDGRVRALNSLSHLLEDTHGWSKYELKGNPDRMTFIGHAVPEGYSGSNIQKIGPPDVNTKRSNQTKKSYKVYQRSRRDADVALGDGPRRRSDTPPEDHYAPEGMLALEEVFSTFTDAEIEKLPEEIQTILLPALMGFETMVIRQLESLHSTMVSHDLRLETLEKQHLNWLNSGGIAFNNGSRNNNNSTNELDDILEEDFIAVNNSDQSLNDEAGSGEIDEEVTTTTTITTTTTTTSSAPTTTANNNLYELYRTLASIEQKLLSLENYNTMSDSELIRTRNEVIKMDDKVAEMDRRHRNLQIRTAMQTYRVTELETFMGKTELALHTTLDAFGRMGQRLDSFKDRMSDYKNDIRSVQAQFGRQTQIMTELRSADSYKAHDINELRKSLLGVEERVNSLYRVLDQNVDTVRGDIRTMLERLCFNNNLAC